MRTADERTCKPFTNWLASSIAAAESARMKGKDRRKTQRIPREVVRRLESGDYSVLAPLQNDDEPVLGI